MAPFGDWNWGGGEEWSSCFELNPSMWFDIFFTRPEIIVDRRLQMNKVIL